MKKITRRSFLAAMAAVSAAGVLTACAGSGNAVSSAVSESAAVSSEAVSSTASADETGTHTVIDHGGNEVEVPNKVTRVVIDQIPILSTYIVANENRYHPIRDYLNGLQWVGTERITHVLHHFLGAAEDEYTCEAMKIFLLGAIKRVFQPGCKFETMLCLVGGQGAGKSSFFRLLAVKDEWFSDDLRRLDDDNVYRKLQGHWIIEMSEMIATANAKSIEEIKSFLSKQKNPLRDPSCRPSAPVRLCWHDQSAGFFAP